MHKIILMLLLTFASTCAMAGWIKVSSHASGIFYADPGSIIKSGNKVKMRALHDYITSSKVVGSAFLSSELQEEYDCKDKRSRTLFFSFHSKNMGKGRKVYSDSDPHNWEQVRLGSARETLWQFACKMK